MKNYSRIALLSLLTLTIACSGAKETTTNSSTTTSSSSMYPVWYGSFEFSADSSSFHARATAVASNANTAKIRAEKEARALLESYIAKELENVRSELERDGSDIVSEPAFILKLRNAHLKVEEEATVLQSDSKQSEGVFRGFTKVEINKQTLHRLLEQGFSGNRAYWNTFSSSKSFTEL